MHVRRVVTGFNAEGHSIVIADGPAPRSHGFKHIPSFSNTVVWAANNADAPQGKPIDLTPSLVATPGGSMLFVVQFKQMWRQMWWSISTLHACRMMRAKQPSWLSSITNPWAITPVKHRAKKAPTWWALPAIVMATMRRRR